MVFNILLLVDQPKFNMLELKKDKGTEYAIDLKSKGIYVLKLAPLHCAFLLNIKHFRYKIVIQFNNIPLVIEQNNYATTIKNIYIVYDLNGWPKIPLRNFILKNCFLGATNIEK